MNAEGFNFLTWLWSLSKMNFVGKIVVYRFVVGRGAIVVSGLGFFSLFWVLEMARVLVYCVEAFV